jgi:ABC-type glycerol-3-phosphate transport system substrate-binding protein
MIKRSFVLVFTAFLAAGAVYAGGGKQASGSASLAGYNIIIGSDNRDWDANTWVPKSAYEEKLVAWRKQIQKDYNFTIKQQALGGQDGYSERLTASIMAGNPLAQIFYTFNETILPYYNQGLIYPLDTIPGVDFDATEPVNWNQDIRRFMTFPDGHTYGLTPGYGENRRNYGLVFNKRLLLEVGIDPESIYAMQRAGTWTWDALDEMLRKLTRDTDSDGKIDTWGMANGSLAFPYMASNGAGYISKDAKGNFIHTLNSPALLEAMARAQSLYSKGYVMQGGDGTMAFLNGFAAFRVAGEGDAEGMTTMKDDFGYVLFPRGPRATESTYRIVERDNIFVIPGIYSATEAEKIMRGFMLWMTPPPGTVSGEWKSEEYPKWRDAASVDDTIAAYRSGKYYMFQYERIIPGAHPGDFDQKIGDLSKTPAQIIEAVSQEWAAKIAEANRLLQKK